MKFQRTAERVQFHYEVEKSLASQLRNADRDTRPGLYSELYDELFRTVEDHPQLVERAYPEIEQGRVDGQVRFLEPMLDEDMTFVEIGAGTCSVAQRMRSVAGRVIAVDVSPEITREVEFGDGFEFVLSDGVDFDIADDSVDLVYSNQLMEHLHPDDATEQLRNVFRILRPGGRYFCITPSRLSGPHDVSRGFDDEATGFHLKEYTYAELITRFRDVGFTSFRCIVGYRGYGIRFPVAAVRLLEKALESMPASIRRRLGRFPPVRLALGVKLIAIK